MQITIVQWFSHFGYIRITWGNLGSLQEPVLSYFTPAGAMDALLALQVILMHIKVWEPLLQRTDLKHSGSVCKNLRLGKWTQQALNTVDPSNFPCSDSTLTKQPSDDGLICCMYLLAGNECDDPFGLMTFHSHDNDFSLSTEMFLSLVSEPISGTVRWSHSICCGSSTSALSLLVSAGLLVLTLYMLLASGFNRRREFLGSLAEQREMWKALPKEAS